MMATDTRAPEPWYKFGHVWLVIAGPAIVVVAGFFTLYLALKYPDPVLTPADYPQRIESNATLDNPAASLAPAVQGRNHAQTGVPPTTAAPVAKP